MTEQIRNREHMQAKGRDAFLRGDSIDSHNMNWHAAALADWLAGYNQAAAEAEQPELAEAES